MHLRVMVQCFDWKIKADEVDMEEAPRALVLTMADHLSVFLLLAPADSKFLTWRCH
ncbi:hypothetical protein F2Q70_00022854 [Brassica cretica]|uniref:Uncharacterized protein n=1 Tax=Brassica cretica TaxID=69181 RepID=A0A8S9GGW6_BRACR|nr:hypothetical protein F2Q70_00022854 [Brassica cretica]